MPKNEVAPAAADEGAKELKRLRKMMKGVRVVMLTTVAPDGSLRSRPMVAPDGKFTGQLWFLTQLATGKTEEIRDNQHVNVTYVTAKDDRYASLSGRASVVRDAEQIRELWSARFRSWFPGGKRDPELAAIRVDVERAEYWDAPTSRMIPVAGLMGFFASGAAPVVPEAHRLEAETLSKPSGGAQG